MKFNYLVYDNISGLVFYPIKRQQIIDFIINTIDNKTYFEKYESDCLVKKEELLNKLNLDERKDVINLYNNYYLKNTKLEKTSILSEFDLHRFPEDVFSNKTFVNENQIIEDFLEIQINKYIYRSNILDDLYGLSCYDNYDYTKQVNSVLLLEEFSNYTQEIASIDFTATKEYVKILIAFLKNGNEKFCVELKTPINDNFYVDNWSVKFSENCNKELLKDCIVSNVLLVPNSKYE